MSFFNADMQSLIETYQRETSELMEAFSEGLMRMSQSGTIDQAEINGVFRVVHTVKSTSAMIGINKLSSCSHRMEDLLLLIRDDIGIVHGMESRIIDLLYAYGDYLAAETTSMSDEEYEPAPTDSLDKEINDALNDLCRANRKLSSASDAPVASASGEASFQPPADTDTHDRETVNVRFRDDCDMTNVRAYQLIKKLRPLCKSLTSVPQDLEKKDAAKAISENGLKLVIETDFPEKVEAVLGTFIYIKEFSRVVSSDAMQGDSTAADERRKNEGTERSSKFGMVEWDRIISIRNVAGELITAYTLLKGELTRKMPEMNVEDDLTPIRRLLGELDILASRACMTTVSSIAGQYHRIVRDMAKDEEKQIEFTISGGELELDRSLLDSISSALIHLLRNAVDHGIESAVERVKLGKPEKGAVKLSVESVSGSARFTVSDDGRGIDPAKVLKKAAEKGLLTKPESEYTNGEIYKLIFAPGFSTSVVANKYSGRGVGMDVVKKTVLSLGGVVLIDSEIGKGTEISIETPVSMSSIECIGFCVGRYACMLPSKTIKTILPFREAQKMLKAIDKRQWLDDGALIPVIDMFSLFGEKEDESKTYLVIEDGNRTAALLTGSMQGEQTAVEKPLPAIISSAYRDKYGISGCTTGSFGNLALVLNARMLLRRTA